MPFRKVSIHWPLLVTHPFVANLRYALEGVSRARSGVSAEGSRPLFAEPGPFGASPLAVGGPEPRRADIVLEIGSILGHAVFEEPSR